MSTACLCSRGCHGLLAYDLEVIAGVPARTSGNVDRDGVSIAYQVFGDGPRKLLLMPTWTIVHSDFWRPGSASGAEAARLLGAELNVIHGAGHEPEAREAAEVNELIDAFLVGLGRDVSGPC